MRLHIGVFAGLAAVCSSDLPGAQSRGALATADLDRDGAPELIVGVPGEQGGVILSYSGPFESPPRAESARRLAVCPFVPNILAAGDFDADGHLDLAAVSVGGEALALFAGDGRGRLLPPLETPLPGRVTAAASGETNRADGLADLAIAVASPEGAFLLIFESRKGALGAEPEVIALPEPAAAIAIGQLDDEAPYDLAVAAGARLLIVHGRDRFPVFSGERPAAPPRIVDLAGPASGCLGLLAGDFIHDPDFRHDLAWLAGDGTVHIAELARAESAGGVWRALEGRAAHELAKGRLLASPGDDLLLLDPTGSRLWVHMAAGPETGAAIEPDGLALDAPPTTLLAVRLNGDAQSDLVFLTEGDPVPQVRLTSPAATFTVNSTGDGADANPGNGVCATSTAVCTFRAAIQETNALGTIDAIQFSLGAGTPAIPMANPLPDITSPVTIDGATGGATRVELRIHPSGGGLTLAAGTGGSTLKSLVINGSGAHGVMIQSNANRIENCYIGLNAAGTSIVSNLGSGIRLTGAGANNNVIGGLTTAERNVISGNGASLNQGGVQIDGGAASNFVSGNFIGSNAAGTAGIGNGHGVAIIAPAQNNQVGGLTPVPLEPPGNLIAYCTRQGVMIAGTGASGNLVLGNVVALNGTSTVGTNRDGLRIESGASGNSIGGSTVDARNVIAGNSAGGAIADGIEISGIGTDANRIEGNYIGVDVSGAASFPNGGAEIRITSSAKNNTVGASAASPGMPPGNVMAAAGSAGVVIEGAAIGNTVEGNLIGTDAAGTVELASGALGAYDVLLSGTGGGNVIGGLAAGSRNVIAGNSAGVALDNTVGDTVAGNYIGTNISGTAGLGNSRGVLIQGSSSGNVIGGAAVSPGTPPGNVISANSTGVLISGTNATGNSVRGNLIGTNPAGTAPLGLQSKGIEITNAHDNVIGGPTTVDRNVISGNTHVNALGLDINGANAFGNRIEGNFIGLDVTGSFAVPNPNGGIVIRSAAHDNTIGGASSAAGTPPGNVISGNAPGPGSSADGVEISGGSNANLVQGNLIGTDATGSSAVANGANGVLITAGSTGNTIGGAMGRLRNVISGNNAAATCDGIEISSSSSNVIQANTIGLDRSGLFPLPNGGDGIFLNDAGTGFSSGNTIGGTTAVERNLISANVGSGVRLTGSDTNGNVLSGNYIGVNASGLAAGNGSHGVHITTGSRSNTIGGTTGLTLGSCSGSCNVIGSNGGAGVRIDSGSSTFNGIRANALAANGALGIDLGVTAGVTPNDALDSDSGPNGLQNFPVITGADFDGIDTTISGTLASAASASFTIDVFGNPAPDPSGHGEGRDYLGTTTCMTSGSGSCSFSVTAPGSHKHVAATATDVNGSTSELAAAFVNPMEATGLSVSKGAGSIVNVTFSPACGATDHAVFVGTTPIAGTLAWTSSACGLGVTGTASFDPGTPVSGVGQYFVVVGQHATREGSYGLDATPAQRPEASGVGACDLPRALTVTCF